MPFGTLGLHEKECGALGEGYNKFRPVAPISIRKEAAVNLPPFFHHASLVKYCRDPDAPSLLPLMASSRISFN